MNNIYPIGWYIYSVLIGCSSLLILARLHRMLYSFLHYFSFPDFIISCLAGFTNLSWYEIGYVIGGGLKNVQVFSLLPLLGGVTGLISALLLFSRIQLGRYALLAHLGLSIVFGLLSLAVLSWRSLRGIDDYWRFISSFAFLLMYCLWMLYFYRTRYFIHVP